MSTKLHDLATRVQYGASLAPATYTATENGAAVDLLAADGRGFAVLHAGGVGLGTTAAVRLEQSADATTWAAIPGATFANVTTGPQSQVLGFERSARYVRAVAEITGGSPSAALCVGIGQQKKTM